MAETGGTITERARADKSQTPLSYPRTLDIPPFPEFGEDYLPKNVFTHFHFAAHRRAEHFEGIKELLQGADFFIPESVRWNERALRKINQIARGDAKVLARIKQETRGSQNEDYTCAMYDGIFGSYKPVLYIDADESQKECATGDTAPLYRKAIGTDVEATLDGLADVVALIAEKSTWRDAIMAHNLSEFITDRVTKHPKLKDTPRVVVLCVLGFTHTQLFSAMSASPALKERVTATSWIGNHAPDPESKIVTAYKEGQASTRQALEELMIAYALSTTILPTFDHRYLYAFDRAPTRIDTPFNRIGPAMIEEMLKVPEVSLPIAQRILTSQVTHEDGLLLVELAEQAKSVTR